MSLRFKLSNKYKLRKIGGSTIATKKLPPKIDDRVPVGSILLHAGTTPPADYLFCDGSSVSKYKYRKLYRVIRNRYGPSTATTFTLPNMVEKFPRGASGYGITSDTGAPGGSDTVTLVADNLPNHYHTTDADGTGYGIAKNGTNTWNGSFTTDNVGHEIDLKTAASKLTFINTTTDASGNDPVNNDDVTVTNPYIKLHYVIRYKN